MRPLTLPISDLGRRPMRSTLTALGIAVAVGSFIAMVGLSRGVEQAWVNYYLDRGTHLLAVRKGAVEILDDVRRRRPGRSHGPHRGRPRCGRRTG